MAQIYRPQITPRATADLRAIFRYIQKDSPQNAAGVIAQLLDEIEKLELLPNRFKVVGVSHKANAPVHSLVVRPFIIYYRIDEATYQVPILIVRHGARRQLRQFD